MKYYTAVKNEWTTATLNKIDDFGNIELKQIQKPSYNISIL